jgi:hypothetical protein
MLIVDREEKEAVEDFLDNLFDKFPDNFQPGQFQKPQCGGNNSQKQRINDINNYLNKLEERVQTDLLMYDEESLSTTPPSRPRRMTISYAQAARRLSFHAEKQATTQQTKIMHANETMTTSMSTLTQTSLEAALSKIRVETENSINQLGTEFKNEVQNMEDKIASAVIKAIWASPPVDSMETDYAENNSIQSSNTVATMQTLADKYDLLHNAMIMLTKTVTEMAERQEQAQNKRTRPLGTPPKFQLPPTWNHQNLHSEVLRQRFLAPMRLIARQLRLLMGPRQQGPGRVNNVPKGNSISRETNNITCNQINTLNRFITQRPTFKLPFPSHLTTEK